VPGSIEAAIRRCIARTDFALQPWFRLCREIRAERDSEPKGSAFSSAYWSEVRRRGTAPFDGFDRYESDASYRRYLESIRESKLRAAESLLDTFDFGRYRRILEIGSGDMPQAYLTRLRHPQITYTATDFDAFVIDQCGKLPMLSEIHKEVLDANAVEASQLRNIDLLLSWSLEFSLDDAQLVRLFSACREASVPYLLCSHTTIGPLRYAAGAREVAAGGPRKALLGRLRSVGAIVLLANSAGLTLRWKAWHVNHAALFLAP
jgi:hypothetical protein